MATRIVARNLLRNFSTSGKILSMEERAAKNVYIKKAEQELLEKLARKGPKPRETKAASSGGSASVTDAKPSGESYARETKATSSGGSTYVTDAKPSGESYARETKAASSGGSASITDAKPSGESYASKFVRYVISAGVFVFICALGLMVLPLESRSAKYRTKSLESSQTIIGKGDVD